MHGFSNSELEAIVNNAPEHAHVIALVTLEWKYVDAAGDIVGKTGISYRDGHNVGSHFQGWVNTINLSSLRNDLKRQEVSERDIADYDDGDIDESLIADEWVNGDECEIEGYGNDWQYGCDVPNSESSVVFRIGGSSNMIIPKSRLIKPETQEQKEREYQVGMAMDSINIELSEMAISETRKTQIETIYALYDAGYLKTEKVE